MLKDFWYGLKSYWQQYIKEDNNFTIKIILITTISWSKQFLEQQLHDETNHEDTIMHHDFHIIN